MENSANKENQFFSTGETEESPFKALSSLVKSTYLFIDKSNLSSEEKRNLLFSLYCFRAIFDGEELHRLSKTLLKYGVSFITDASNKGKEGVYEIKDGKGKTYYKYDALSPLFIEKLRSRSLGNFNSIPQKYTLYEMVYKIINLSSATNALKSDWYAFFPYVLLLDAPVEHDIYDLLKEALCTDKIFSHLLYTDEGDSIYVDLEDMDFNNPLVADWYTPYIEWRKEKINGKARYCNRIENLIKEGKYQKAVAFADAYVPAYADDEQLLLLDITARVTLATKVDEKDRKEILLKNMEIIKDALSTTENHRAELLHFSAMTKIGLFDVDGAILDLNASLEADPNFLKSKMMLEGIKKIAELQKDKD